MWYQKRTTRGHIPLMTDRSVMSADHEGRDMTRFLAPSKRLDIRATAYSIHLSRPGSVAAVRCQRKANSAMRAHLGSSSPHKKSSRSPLFPGGARPTSQLARPATSLLPLRVISISLETPISVDLRPILREWVWEQETQGKEVEVLSPPQMVER